MLLEVIQVPSTLLLHLRMSELAFTVDQSLHNDQAASLQLTIVLVVSQQWAPVQFGNSFYQSQFL